MARPRTQANAVATPERILLAAEQAFADHGYGPAKLADIARVAGIRRPSLLYHFATKEVLYAAVVSRTFERLGRALAEGGGRRVRSASRTRLGASRSDVLLVAPRF